jgi:uncharacterized membrane protein
MSENAVLTAKAREILKGQWTTPVLASLIYMVITGGASAIPRIGPLLSLIITGPMILGFAIFFLNFTRRKNVEYNMLFEGFKYFGNALAAYLLTVLYVFLWSLLLIIPGIIAAMSYAMTFYILADDPTIRAPEALRKSKVMMDGYKMKLFLLGLRFIGWLFLSILTFGIGFLFLIPYITTSFMLFYEDIRGNTVTVNDQKEVVRDLPKDERSKEVGGEDNTEGGEKQEG